MEETLDALAEARVLGALLEELAQRALGYDLVAHWQQGEFHHDVVLVPKKSEPFGPTLVVATNCNGGVKEVLSFAAMPERAALWHWRCPTDPSFSGELPLLLGRAVTEHWFDPCELLRDDARSELKEEFREKQDGGGWTMKRCGTKR
jgi:hypothetical protein